MSPVWIPRGRAWLVRTAAASLLQIAVGVLCIEGGLGTGDLRVTRYLLGYGGIAVGGILTMRALREAGDSALWVDSDSMCVNAFGFRPSVSFRRTEPIEFAAMGLPRLGYVLRFSSQTQGVSRLFVSPGQLGSLDPESLRRRISEWRLGGE